MDAFAWPLAALAALVFFVLLYRRQIGAFLERAESIGKGGIKAYPKEIAQSQTGAPAPATEALAPNPAGSTGSAVQKLKTEDLLRELDTPLILERDKFIREDLERLENPADREKVLIRHLAGSNVVREFERVYGLIFGSQIGALEDLNSAGHEGLPVERIQAFYNDAVARYPAMYERLTFEEWIGFLKLSVLIQDSENGYAITLWGHEFLIHLVRSRKPVFRLF